MALGSVFRAGFARAIQQGLVAASTEVSRHRAARATERGRFRRRSEVPCALEFSLRAVLHRRYPAVSVSSRTVAHRWMSGAAEPLFDLRQSGGWTSFECNARDGR